MFSNRDKYIHKQYEENKRRCKRNSHCSSAITNPAIIYEHVGLNPGLAQWVKGSGAAVNHGRGCRLGSDPALLWLWRRPLATANSTPSLGASICCTCGPKKKKKKLQKNTCSIISLKGSLKTCKTIFSVCAICV